jgi:hypothetical protein
MNNQKQNKKILKALQRKRSLRKNTLTDQKTKVPTKKIHRRKEIKRRKSKKKLDFLEPTQNMITENLI